MNFRFVDEIQAIDEPSIRQGSRIPHSLVACRRLEKSRVTDIATETLQWGFFRSAGA